MNDGKDQAEIGPDPIIRWQNTATSLGDAEIVTIQKTKFSSPDPVIAWVGASMESSIKYLDDVLPLPGLFCIDDETALILGIPPDADLVAEYAKNLSERYLRPRSDSVGLISLTDVLKRVIPQQVQTLANRFRESISLSRRVLILAHHHRDIDLATLSNLLNASVQSSETISDMLVQLQLRRDDLLFISIKRAFERQLQSRNWFLEEASRMIATLLAAKSLVGDAIRWATRPYYGGLRVETVVHITDQCRFIVGESQSWVSYSGTAMDYSRIVAGLYDGISEPLGWHWPIPEGRYLIPIFWPVFRPVTANKNSVGAAFKNYRESRDGGEVKVAEEITAHVIQIRKFLKSEGLLPTAEEIHDVIYNFRISYATE